MYHKRPIWGPPRVKIFKKTESDFKHKIKKSNFYLSGDIEQFGASVTLTAEPGEPLGTATADCWRDGNGLDIVDSGWTA